MATATQRLEQALNRKMIFGPGRIVTRVALLNTGSFAQMMTADLPTEKSFFIRIDANRKIFVHVLLALLVGFALPCDKAFPQASDSDQPWANVSGRILLEGKVPEIPLEKIDGHKDRSICLVDGKIPTDDSLVVDETGGLRDVFVILTPLDSETKIPVHPSYHKAANTTLELDNRNCRFVPHAMAVMTGQSILLKNSDAVGHNCKIASFNNEHNVNLPAGGEAEIKLELADRIPANVACDIHPWMDALILAKDHPYVAITSVDGSFQLKNVPMGKWKLQFWHQRFGYLRKLSVPGVKVDRKGRIDLDLADAQAMELGSMKLPVSAIK